MAAQCNKVVPSDSFACQRPTSTTTTQGILQGGPSVKVTSCYSRGKDSCIYRGEITPGKPTDKAVQRGYDSILRMVGAHLVHRGRGRKPTTTTTINAINRRKKNNTHRTEVMLLRTIGFRVVNPKVLGTSRLDKNVIWGYLFRCLSQNITFALVTRCTDIRSFLKSSW